MAVLVLYVAGLAALVLFAPRAWPLLLVWPLGHCFLSLYLPAEHTGLPSDGSRLHRTRSMRSNALVRWFLWNMPYHAEHHAWPAVPFHALPALHAEMKDHLVHRESLLYLHLHGGRDRPGAAG